jgi:hypothetical protein
MPESPIGTLFPSFDGSMPGEVKDGVGTNLEDTPVLPKFDTFRQDPAYNPSAIAGPTGQVIREGDEGPADNAAEEGAEAPGAKPGRGSRLQERIGRLTRARREAENSRDQIGSQLAAVLAQNQELMSQLVQSRAAPVAAPSATTAGSGPFAGGENAGGAVPITAADVLRIVEGSVQRALAPVVQSQQGSSRAAATRVAHERSFAEAAAEYPDLRDPDTDLRKTFNELYDNSDEDFVMRPDAPYRLALEARALLADERRSEQRTARRKVAAGVHVPTPTATDTEVSVGETRVVKEGVDAAKQRMRLGQATFDDYKIIRLAGLKQTR